jgi:hypothetical protein
VLQAAGRLRLAVEALEQLGVVEQAGEMVFSATRRPMKGSRAL